MALVAIASAVAGTQDTNTRLLLAAVGGVALACLLPSLKPHRPHLRLARPRRIALDPLPEFLHPADIEASDGRGWSYGEVRARVYAELAVQVRGILALVSLMVIAQVGVGFLLMDASPIVLFAVEATLWAGIALGLHLGWRGWRVLTHERQVII